MTARLSCFTLVTFGVLGAAICATYIDSTMRGWWWAFAVIVTFGYLKFLTDMETD